MTEHRDSFEAFEEEVINTAVDAVTFVLDNHSPRRMAVSEVEDQVGVDRAIHCARLMQQRGSYQGQKLGLINPSIPEAFSLGNLRRGQVILFTEQDNGQVTIDEPYSEDHIEMEEQRGSGLMTYTTINVPLFYIRPLGK